MAPARYLTYADVVSEVRKQLADGHAQCSYRHDGDQYDQGQANGLFGDSVALILITKPPDPREDFATVHDSTASDIVTHAMRSRHPTN